MSLLIKLLCLILIVCSSSASLFSENWELGVIDNSKWNSWGYPLPNISSPSHKLGNYSLDSNGDSAYLSGVVSVQTFTHVAGLELSIDAYIQSASQWSELEFGFSNTTTIDTTPQYFEYSTASLYIDADTQGFGHNRWSYFNNSYGATSAGSDPLINAELPNTTFDSWHNYKFTFTDDQTIQISIDNILAYESPIHWYDYDSDNEVAIYLGGRSYGSTENLYDNITLSIIPEPNAVMLITSTFASFMLIRRRTSS